jgi:hypothetical protein
MGKPSPTARNALINLACIVAVGAAIAFDLSRGAYKPSPRVPPKPTVPYYPYTPYNLPPIQLSDPLDYDQTRLEQAQRDLEKSRQELERLRARMREMGLEPLPSDVGKRPGAERPEPSGARP